MANEASLVCFFPLFLILFENFIKQLFHSTWQWKYIVSKLLAEQNLQWQYIQILHSPQLMCTGIGLNLSWCFAHASITAVQHRSIGELISSVCRGRGDPRCSQQQLTRRVLHCPRRHFRGCLGFLVSLFSLLDFSDQFYVVIH